MKIRQKESKNERRITEFFSVITLLYLFACHLLCLQANCVFNLFLKMVLDFPSKPLLAKPLIMIVNLALGI